MRGELSKQLSFFEEREPLFAGGKHHPRRLLAGSVYFSLDSIRYSITDKSTNVKQEKSVDAEGLNRVYEKYLDGQNIVASWYSGKLHLGKRV